MQVSYTQTNDDEVLNGISRKENPYHKIWKIVDDYKKLLNPYDDSKKEALEKLLSNNYNMRQIMLERERRTHE